MNSRGLDLLQDNTATSQVLVLDEFLGMFALLFSTVLEELGKAFQGNIIPIEIGILRLEEKTLEEPHAYLTFTATQQDA